MAVSKWLRVCKLYGMRDTDLVDGSMRLDYVLTMLDNFYKVSLDPSSSASVGYVNELWSMEIVLIDPCRRFISCWISIS